MLGAPSAAPTPVAWPLGGVERSPHVISPGEGGMPPTLRLAELGAGTFVVLVAMVVWARPAFAVPSSAGCLFGAPSLSEGSRKSRDADVAVGLGWARRLIALPALPVAWLAGEADSAGGAVLRVIVVPMVGSLGDACPRLPRQTAQAVGWGWTDITGVASGDGALVVGSAAARVQSFVQAGAHSPMALRVGRGATMAVGGSSGAATRACFAARVAAAEYAVASLRVGLQRAQRASAGTLAAFFGQLGERVLPLPLGEIPEALRAEVVLYDDAALDLQPWRHDAHMPHTRACPPPPAVPHRWPEGVQAPMCHADVLEPWCFEAACSDLDRFDEWHRASMSEARASRRPRGKVYGLAGVRPAWRPFFEAGGVIDFSVTPPVPYSAAHAFETHVRAEYARKAFSDTPDQAAAQLWQHGVCMHAPQWHSGDGACDDTAVLALAPNLLSTYPAAAGPIAEQFAGFESRGWTRRAAHASCRGDGHLGAASLPFLSAPCGGVDKRGSPEPRVIASLGWPDVPLCFEARLGVLYGAASRLPLSQRHFGDVSGGG